MMESSKRIRALHFANTFMPLQGAVVEWSLSYTSLG